MSSYPSTADGTMPTPDSAAIGPEPASVYESRIRAAVVIALGRDIMATLRAIGRAFTWIDRRADEARAMQELARINERMLADAGLSRSDIPLVGPPDANRAAA